MTCPCLLLVRQLTTNAASGCALITRVTAFPSHAPTLRGTLAIARPCTPSHAVPLLSSSASKAQGLFLPISAHSRASSRSTSKLSRTDPEALMTAMKTVASTPAEIIAQLPASFEKATEAGDLLFFPSTVHNHTEFGVEWEIRLCPALQKKPHLPTPHFDAEADERLSQLSSEGKKYDPFSPPYVPNLHLGELKDEQEGDEYVVLFNKFSVVPHHILLITKEFHSQTSPLLPPDIVQTYKLLVAARNAGKKFFAFYNCGDNSGASQPHKHLQLIPTTEDGPPIEKLARKTTIETAERPFSLQSLPYANHVYRFPGHLPSAPPDEQESILSRSFLFLLDLALSTYRRDPAIDVPGSHHAHTLSYNVILTLDHMHVIPRKAEIHTLAETGDNLSVNAMGFAGCLLVKSEREFEAVVKESVGTILGSVGCKSIHDQQCEGACSL